MPEHFALTTFLTHIFLVYNDQVLSGVENNNRLIGSRYHCFVTNFSIVEKTKVLETQSSNVINLYIFLL